MNLELNVIIMSHSTRNSFGTAFTLGIGAGILIHSFIKKVPVSSKSNQRLQDIKSESYKFLKTKFYDLKDFSAELVTNPIPDLYKATDSFTLNEEDLIHATG